MLGPLGVHKRAARGDISPLVVNHFNLVFGALAQSDEENTRRRGDGRETVQRGRGSKRQGAENGIEERPDVSSGLLACSM